MRFLIFFIALLNSALAQYSSVELPIGRKGKNTTLHYYIFSNKTHTLEVIEQSAADAFQDLAGAMDHHKCIAGCNGGFFILKEGVPAGLVIANGKISGSTDRKSSIISATIFTQDGEIHFQRSQAFNKRDIPLPANLLQTGPFLVENHIVHPDLKDKHHVHRTFLASDNNGRFLIGYIRSTTLSSLSKILAQPNTIPGFRIHTAVNLDGGPSSAFWVGGETSPVSKKEKHQVINYLGVVSRPDYQEILPGKTLSQYLEEQNQRTPINKVLQELSLRTGLSVRMLLVIFVIFLIPIGCLIHLLRYLRKKKRR